MAAPLIPHHYCSFDFSNDAVSEETSNMQQQQQQFPFLSYDVNSPVSVASFPDSHFGLASDYMVVPQMSEIETGFRDFSVTQLEDQCTFWPPNYEYNNPMLPENWGIQGKAAADEVKVGRYSVEERKDRILRYLKKRNHRNFNKTIKYACRKTLADKRVRVRGRFAKNNEPSQDEISMDSTHHHHNSFHDDSSLIQMMKYDEEYWLQAAMDNLGHFPYLGSC